MKQNKVKTEPIKTVLVILVGLLVVFLVTKVQAVLIVSVAIGIFGLMSAFLAQKIDFLWMKLSWMLSLILPNILMGVIFYLFLTPIALLSKVFGEKNQLSLKNTNKSLFKDRDKSFSKESFEKLW